MDAVQHTMELYQYVKVLLAEDQFDDLNREDFADFEHVNLAPVKSITPFNLPEYEDHFDLPAHAEETKIALVIIALVCDVVHFQNFDPRDTCHGDAIETKIERHFGRMFA